MLGWQRGASGTTQAGNGRPAAVEVGILTRGKPTLGIALTSLLLQDVQDIRVHIIDTSDSPVVNRDDVTLAMRLAFDREIHCSYERLREKKRGFSIGRLRLLELLQGPHVCFVDDDMALSSTVIGSLLAAARSQPTPFGCIRPACHKATVPLGSSPQELPYTPGSLLYLDETLRRLMAGYYASTVDVVDAAKAGEKVWEVAFLGEVLRQLGRPCLCEPDAVIYHLDHHDLANWHLGDGAIVRRSLALARQLAAPAAPEPLAV